MQQTYCISEGEVHIPQVMKWGDGVYIIKIKPK